MYQEIFDFTERPFTMAPYVKHFFEGGPVKESFDQICESISRDAGPAIVIGQHGTGKTLLLTLLSEQYQQRFKVISLSCGPMSERRDLLQSVLFELKQPYRDLSEGELRLSLIDFIKPTANCPNGVLLLIDDAQALTSDLVDELRLITNFVRDGLPRVRLVLCGTGRFEEILTEPKLEPFNQRISTRCFLGNLTREQTQAYIHEHIARAGGDSATMFDHATTEAIHEVTCGCPRFVNQLAEQCMIYAATQGSMIVESNMVKPAWAQVQGLPSADPNAPVPTESTDENWTVIEFGSLDDEDVAEEPEETSTPADNPTASTDESDELSSDSVDVEITGESVDTPASEPDLSQTYPQWGGTDPFVAHEPVAEEIGIVGSEDQTDEAAVSADTDLYEYEPLTASIDDEEIDVSAEANSIPTEFRDLAQQQEETWAAAGVADDTLGDESVAQLDSLDEQTSLESTGEEPSSVSESLSLADSALPVVPAVAAAVAASMANPFSETFDTEEPVSSEFTEQVAEQNVSSMSVTGEQLDRLSPTDEDLSNNSGIPVVSLADEAGPMPEQLTEEPQPESEPIDSELGTQVEQPAPAEYTADELVSAFDSLGAAETATDDAEIPTAELNPVAGLSEPEVASQTDVTSSVTDQTSSDTDAWEPTAQLETPAYSTEADTGASDFHQHNTGQPTADIQQQANEILNSIRAPEPDQNDTTAEAASQVPPEEDDDAPQAARENVEISEAQRILAEILEHKQLLSDQVTPPASESPAADITEFPQSLPIQQSYSSEAPDETSPTGNVSEPTSPNSPYDNDGTPVSIGRAERMNYEKLFEQLRNNDDQT